MPSLDRLFIGVRATGTNKRLDFGLFWDKTGNPASRPCKIWCGSREPRLAKESVAPKRRRSAGWMPERIGRWSACGAHQCSC